METTYRHFDYCERLARRLKDVAHDDHRPRFFTAFGLEDLYNFEDRLSGVTGTVLIAVDGTEMESTWNRAEGLADASTYSIILARNTRRDQPHTIDRAVAHCRTLALQVRNCLLADTTLNLRREFALNGIGPIGDGFYGVVLTYVVEEYPDYGVDERIFLLNEE